MIITLAFLVNLLRALYLVIIQVYRIVRKKFMIKKKVVRISTTGQEASRT